MTNLHSPSRHIALAFILITSLLGTLGCSLTGNAISEDKRNAMKEAEVISSSDSTISSERTQPFINKKVVVVLKDGEKLEGKLYGGDMYRIYLEIPPDALFERAQIQELDILTIEKIYFFNGRHGGKTGLLGAGIFVDLVLVTAIILAMVAVGAIGASGA